MNIVSEYSKFYFDNLGHNFRNTRTREVITKGEYFKRYGSAYSDTWEWIPFEPKDGWNSEQEKSKHFAQVAEIRKELESVKMQNIHCGHIAHTPLNIANH